MKGRLKNSFSCIIVFLCFFIQSFCLGQQATRGCTQQCNGGFSCCENKCVDFQNNFMYCGSCQRSCSMNELCCGGSCVRINFDSKNCGKCGSSCRENEICINRICVRTESTKEESIAHSLSTSPVFLSPSLLVNVPSSSMEQQSPPSSSLPPQKEKSKSLNHETTKNVQRTECVLSISSEKIQSEAVFTGIMCDNICVNVQNDINGCGDCWTQCSRNQICENGSCKNRN